MTENEMKTTTTFVIDEMTLYGFMNMVVEICREKAIHIEKNLQIVPLAEKWNFAAQMFERLNDKHITI